MSGKGKMMRAYNDWEMGGAKIFSVKEMADTVRTLGENLSFALTSGGYAPIHPGHISQLAASSKEASFLIVVVNGDDFLINKHGKAFQPLKVRSQIVSMLRVVDFVVPFNPSRVDDTTVCEAISIIKPHVFTKGGDRDASNTPEYELCKSLGVDFVQGMGDDKLWSSSGFLGSWEDYKIRRYIDENSCDF